MSNKELANYLKRLAMAIPKGAPKDLDGLSFAWGQKFADVTPEAMEILLDQAMETFEYFPSLKELKDMLMGSAEDKAKEIGQVIWAALGRYGSQMSRMNEIKAAIGPLGEQVVNAMGGWLHLCETLTDDQRGTFIAQTRDLALAMQRKPVVSQSPTLPSTGAAVHRQIADLADRFSLGSASRQIDATKN